MNECNIIINDIRNNKTAMFCAFWYYNYYNINNDLDL